MIRFKKNFAIVLLSALIITACSRASEQFSAAAPAAPAADFAMEEAEIAFEESAGESFASDEDSFASSANQSANDVQRLIIRTADMSIIVQDTETAMDEITQLVVANGGWVVSSNVFQFDERAKTGSLTLRVPSEGFDSALDAIQALSLEVTRISTSGQDVTEEFVDLSARLENLEATAARVRNFLDETRNVEEALAVNQELSRLEGEIEAMKGRLQYLQQSAAFSTITVDLTPDILSQPIEVAGWRPQGVARSAVESLISALQSIVDIIIWLVIFALPIALIIGVPVWLIIRFWRRRRASRRAESTTEAVEEIDQE